MHWAYVHVCIIYLLILLGKMSTVDFYHHLTRVIYLMHYTIISFLCFFFQLQWQCCLMYQILFFYFDEIEFIVFCLLIMFSCHFQENSTFWRFFLMSSDNFVLFISCISSFGPGFVFFLYIAWGNNLEYEIMHHILRWQTFL